MTQRTARSINQDQIRAHHVAAKLIAKLGDQALLTTTTSSYDGSYLTFQAAPLPGLEDREMAKLTSMLAALELLGMPIPRMSFSEHGSMILTSVAQVPGVKVELYVVLDDEAAQAAAREWLWPSIVNVTPGALAEVA